VLDLSGCIITIDAMGTQTAIAAHHIANADYVLAPTIPNSMGK